MANDELIADEERLAGNLNQESRSPLSAPSRRSIGPPEPLPSFKPSLVSSKKVRAGVSSSGYGVNTVVSPMSQRPKEKKEDTPSFTPDLTLTSKVRGAASSSGYGTTAVVVRPKSATTSEDKVAEEKCSFKPDMSKTKKVRSTVTSTGYGNVVIGKKPVPAGESPVFKPDLSKTKKARMGTSSTGYGKQVVNKRAPPAPEAHPFSPNLKGVAGKTAAALRKNTRSKYQEPSRRPQSAPARPQAREMPRYTLAADKGTKIEDERPVGSFEFGIIGRSPLDNAEASGKFSRPKSHIQMLESASSNAYGRGWAPKVAEKPMKDVEPKHFVAGSRGSTYIDHPAEIDMHEPSKTQIQMKESAVANYGASYTPKRVVAEPKKKEFPVVFTHGPAVIAALDELPAVPVGKGAGVAVSSSGYISAAYSPAVDAAKIEAISTKKLEATAKIVSPPAGNSAFIKSVGRSRSTTADSFESDAAGGDEDEMLEAGTTDIKPDGEQTTWL